MSVEYLLSKSLYLDGISLVEKSISSVFAHFYLSFSVSMCVIQLSSQTFHNHKYLDSGYYVKGMHNIASVFCTLVKSNIFKIHLYTLYMQKVSKYVSNDVWSHDLHQQFFKCLHR